MSSALESYTSGLDPALDQGDILPKGACPEALER